LVGGGQSDGFAELIELGQVVRVDCIRLEAPAKLRPAAERLASRREDRAQLNMGERLRLVRLEAREQASHGRCVGAHVFTGPKSEGELIDENPD
jgi:hypothetical protein